MAKKVGIMGGTFDPIHNGHLLLAKQAYEEYQLDEVWFLPSGHPPHKTDHKVTTVIDRLAMVRLAIADVPHYYLSDLEAIREGNSYTYQTLQLLNQQYPDNQFFFIIGADSLFELEDWKCPDQVMSQVTLLVAGRDYVNAPRSMEAQIAYLSDKYGARIFCLHCEEVDISSASIRAMVTNNQPIIQYLPKCVEQYIVTHHLYQ